MALSLCRNRVIVIFRWLFKLDILGVAGNHHDINGHNILFYASKVHIKNAAINNEDLA